MLSGRYPFFEASDDLAALAEIIAIFGSDEIGGVAQLLGKKLYVGVGCRKSDLGLLCKRYFINIHLIDASCSDSH